LMHTWQGIRSPRPGYVITKTIADPSTPVAGATCARDDIAAAIAEYEGLCLSFPRFCAVLLLGPRALWPHTLTRAFEN
jgi:hypothetical protein